MSDLHAFRDRMRKLLSIDMRQLVAAGVISSDDTNAWQSFCNSPHKWMIRASDGDAAKVWAIMEAGQ